MIWKTISLSSDPRRWEKEISANPTIMKSYPRLKRINSRRQMLQTLHRDLILTANQSLLLKLVHTELWKIHQVTSSYLKSKERNSFKHLSSFKTPKVWTKRNLICSILKSMFRTNFNCPLCPKTLISSRAPPLSWLISSLHQVEINKALENQSL